MPSGRARALKAMTRPTSSRLCRTGPGSPRVGLHADLPASWYRLRNSDSASNWLITLAPSWPGDRAALARCPGLSPDSACGPYRPLAQNSRTSRLSAVLTYDPQKLDIRNQMTESLPDRVSLKWKDENESFYGLGIVLLRRRRMILWVALAGALVGFTWGLLQYRQYVSSTTFIPETSDDQSLSSLAAAASQFGFTLPTKGSSWGPSVYVDLLQSDALLRHVATDTLAVAEMNGQRVALADLLDVTASTAPRRTAQMIRELHKHISVSEDRGISAATISVTTRWPSVSLAIVKQLLQSVNEFNLETRQSQARAERVFVEQQATDAKIALRAAEDTLRDFLERNRTYAGSPQLQLVKDRLDREVSMRQQVYTTLMQSLEQARIREVRDTPVFTVLEPPMLPVLPSSRHWPLKILLGGLLGGLLGIFIAYPLERLPEMRGRSTDEAREFFELLELAAPRFLASRHLRAPPEEDH